MEASAVCRYNISEVQRAFEGPYMEYQDSSRKWSRYDGAVPEPRPGSVSAGGGRGFGGARAGEPPADGCVCPPLPGQCITDGSRRRGFNSSQDLPNSVLDFVKLHPLMFEEVQPAGGEPLLVKRSVAYSCLAVDRVRALDGRSYDVLFMGTGECGTWDGSPRSTGDGVSCPLTARLCRGRLAPQGRGAGLRRPHHRGGAGVRGAAARGDPGGLPQAGEGWQWGWGLVGGDLLPCVGRCCELGPFHPRGACTWGQPAGFCRCPWPPAPGTAPATTASSPGTPTAPGTAGLAATRPPGTGRASRQCAHRPGGFGAVQAPGC